MPEPTPTLTPTLAPTPAQTIGPFYGYALPFTGGADLAPAGHPDAITLHGYVYDGAGAPIPDALLEFWQPAPDGSRTGAPGSLRRDPVTGAVLGRHGVDFTGFARVPTDADGHYAIRTLPPGARGRSRPMPPPYLAVCVFARGLLHHLFTTIRPGAYPWRNHDNAWRPAHIHFSVFGTAFTQRLVTQMYFPGDPLFPHDPVLQSVTDRDARERLVATYDHERSRPEWSLGYRWDIVLDGPAATRIEEGR